MKAFFSFIAGFNGCMMLLCACHGYAWLVMFFAGAMALCLWVAGQE